ncbi:MAG TPA: hypothetical protein VGK02_06815 [Candidatus Aquicultor sp.]|jgi:uncharacterized membrane protein
MLGALLLGVAEVFGVGLPFSILSYIAAVGLAVGLVYQYWILPRKPLEVELYDESEKALSQEEKKRRRKRIRTAYYGGWITGLKAYLTEKQDAVVKLHGLRSAKISAANTVLLLFIIVGLTGLSSFQIPTQWQDVTAFVILMVVLIFKPSCLMGERIPGALRLHDRYKREVLLPGVCRHPYMHLDHSQPEGLEARARLTPCEKMSLPRNARALTWRRLSCFHLCSARCLQASPDRYLPGCKLL